MAGIIKVDRVQSDSNLAFNIAGANVAFIDASSLKMVSSNLSLAGTNVITNGKVLTSAQPSGAVLQVVQTIKRDSWSTTSPGTTWTDISGMSATITPTSLTSKILVMYMVWSSSGSSGTYGTGVRVVRDGSPILPSTISATNLGHSNSQSPYFYSQKCDTNTLLDSPASTSALTYKLQFVHEGTSVVYYLNTPGSIVNDGRSVGAVSTLTLMEIAA